MQVYRQAPRKLLIWARTSQHRGEQGWRRGSLGLQGEYSQTQEIKPVNKTSSYRMTALKKNQQRRERARSISSVMEERRLCVRRDSKGWGCRSVTQHRNHTQKALHPNPRRAEKQRFSQEKHSREQNRVRNCAKTRNHGGETASCGSCVAGMQQVLNKCCVGKCVSTSKQTPVRFKTGSHRGS